MKEIFTECYFCHAELKLKYSQKTIYGYPEYEYSIKQVPSLACTKCTNQYQAEPFQNDKTDAFIQFLKSIGLEKAEIEYKDMIKYVDKVLDFKTE